MFVLRCRESGLYVARDSRHAEYTAVLERARVFATREIAELEACEHEVAQSIAELPPIAREAC